MISEFFISCFFGIAEGFFILMPDITWSVDTSAWEFARDILDMVAYLLPMSTIYSVVALVVSLTLLRIVISFIRTVMGLIPFV